MVGALTLSSSCPALSFVCPLSPGLPASQPASTPAGYHPKIDTSQRGLTAVVGEELFTRLPTYRQGRCGWIGYFWNLGILS